MRGMDVFQALAEPTRRNIVEMIARAGELSSTEIADEFEMTAPAISQHLKVLREANIVQVEKRAQQRIYHINPHALFEVQDWAKHMTQVWNQRFDALERVLAAEKRRKHDKRK